ncbi:hypothetical protein V9T40_005821 [Parthenolecanium corni]|uniref:Transcription initiation factor TFIID subunit 9 n=1 Tax=Parthenolecanium corni TaxID=536013 RepID=A0AAN9TT85_9HEMI
MSSANVKYIPKDAQVIMAILKELGINDFDPRVINQLLEFIYWHSTITLDDARVFANHAKKKNIDVDDVKLAIQMHAEKMSSSEPPRDILLELARSKNSTSLAPIKPQSGIRLPPDRYCLTQPNYKLKSNLSSAPKKNSTSQYQSSFSNRPSTEVRFSIPSSSSVKQMPVIPRTPVSSSDFISKDLTSGSSSVGNVIINPNVRVHNLNHMDIKTESEIDLMDQL